MLLYTPTHEIRVLESSGGWSVGESLCLLLLPQFSAHLNEFAWFCLNSCDFRICDSSSFKSAYMYLCNHKCSMLCWL